MEYVRSLQLKKGETIPLRRGLTWLRRREVWMCVRVKGHREEVKSLKRGNLSSQSVLCSQGCQFFDKICWKLNFFSKFSKLFQFVPNSSIIPWNFRFLKNSYIIPIFDSLFQLFQMWQPWFKLQSFETSELPNFKLLIFIHISLHHSLGKESLVSK